MPDNPFSPPSTLSHQKAVCGDARLLQSGFLYRVIEFEQPLGFRLEYSGWWFWQRVRINGNRVWFRISWLRIWSQLEFDLPAEVDSSQPEVKIEISFRPGLIIQRFRIWVAQQIVFDQVS